MSVFPYSLFLMKHRTLSGWMTILLTCLSCVDAQTIISTRTHNQKNAPFLLWVHLIDSVIHGITVEQYCAFNVSGECEHCCITNILTLQYSVLSNERTLLPFLLPFCDVHRHAI